jgi:hypothetical protein
LGVVIGIGMSKLLVLAAASFLAGLATGVLPGTPGRAVTSLLPLAAADDLVE